MQYSVILGSAACCVLLLMGGCVTTQQTQSPYQTQADALTAAYQRGEFSANEYFARMNDLQ